MVLDMFYCCWCESVKRMHFCFLP